jgi:hypothetical protein
MRERTPAAGAFNAPTIPGDYAVLCAPELSSRVVYHARRPVLASAEAIANSPANLAEVARTLESADFERLVRVMHSADAAYVIASPRFTASSGSSALRQLSSATADDASSFAGFTRIHASPIGSADVGPVLSIWRLDAPRPPPAPARLAPR